MLFCVGIFRRVLCRIVASGLVGGVEHSLNTLIIMILPSITVLQHH